MTSTNEVAHQWISKTNPTDGTVILADYQTDGRGQHGKSWESKTGRNLTCSIIYLPDFMQAEDQYVLNMAVALAVRQTIQQLLPDLTIEVKWPNDIMAGRHKIAGILIENALHGKQLKQSIIGIGLNVNQRDFEHLPQATSLHRCAGEEFDRFEVLNLLCLQVESQYLRLKHGQLEGIVINYNEHLHGRDQEVNIIIDGMDRTAVPSHVDSKGQLVAMMGQEKMLFKHGDLIWSGIVG